MDEAAGDFNKDGKMDFAVANGGGGSAALPGSVTVFLGRGDGTVSSAGSFTAGVTPYSLVAAGAELGSERTL